MICFLYNQWIISLIQGWTPHPGCYQSLRLRKLDGTPWYCGLHLHNVLNGGDVNLGAFGGHTFWHAGWTLTFHLVKKGLQFFLYVSGFGLVRSFSNFLKGELTLWTWELASFPIQAFAAVNFSLSTASVTAHTLLHVVVFVLILFSVSSLVMVFFVDPEVI